MNKNKDVLYQNSLKQAFEIAQKIIATDAGKKIYREYRHKLEFDGDRRIDIVHDEEIPTAAKFIDEKKRLNQDLHDLKINRINAVEHNLESPANSESPNPDNNPENPKI